MNDERVDRLEAIESIRRLLSFYCDAVSRRTPDAIGQLFAEDARVTIAGGPERVGRKEIVAGLQRTMSGFSYLHQKYDAGLIDVDGGIAHGRVTIMEMNRPVDGEMFNAIFGTYEDEYRREAGRWFFMRRAFTLHFRALMPVIEVSQFPAFNPEHSFLP